MDLWEEFIRRFPLEDQPALRHVAGALRSQGGVEELEQLTVLQVEEFALVLAAMTGEDPLTAAFNPALLGKAAEILEIAREVVAEQRRPQRPGRRPSRPAPEPAPEPCPEPEPAPAPRPSPAGSPLSVSGKVRLADGSPWAGGTVRAWDRGLRRRELLGEAVTDGSGTFRITYSRKHLRRPEQGASLVVGAFAAPGDRDALAESPVRFGAGPEERIDLEIPAERLRPPSEHGRLLAALGPHLEGTELADLTPADVEFLAGAAKLEPGPVSALAAAARLERQSGVAAPAFYAFIREGLPEELSALLDRPEEERAEALRAALRENRVALSFRDLRAALKRLQELESERILDRPAPAGSSLGALLDSTCLSREQQKRFAHLYTRHRGAEDELWRKLSARRDFSPEAIADLRLSLRLGELTESHAPLVHALREVHQPASESDLARLEAEDWLRLARRRHEGRAVGFPEGIPGADEAEKARRLVLRMEEAFPNERVVYRLGTKGLPGDWQPATRRAVETFLEQAAASGGPAVQFGGAPIERQLEAAKVPQAEREQLSGPLSAVQRVFRLTSRESELRALMEGGLTSAGAVARMGRTAFRERFGAAFEDETRADHLYLAAERIAASALVLAGSFGGVPAVLGGTWSPSPTSAPEEEPGEEPGEETETVPTWRALFGGIDGCACERCRSVYSPAAYLVDLLAFLDSPEVNAGAVRAKQALCADGDRPAGAPRRRPDLGTLELSCENAETELPAIDLAIELLENLLVPAQERTNPQTHAAAETLRLAPEHLNEAAYRRLREAVYPWSLPFDLWAEETRGYLHALGLDRIRLIELFRTRPGEDPAPGAPGEAAIEIACELLGLCRGEWEIAAGTSTRKPWELWGYRSAPAAGWTRGLEPLDLFLRRSGLSTSKLDRLLKTRFVNGNGKLRVEPRDAAEAASSEVCDPARLRLSGLTEERLDRIHRFSRLADGLPWTPWELDRALAAVLRGGTRLGAEQLLRLAGVRRLQLELGLPLAELLSWWAPLDTESYTDGDGDLDLSPYARLFENRSVLGKEDLDRLRLDGGAGGRLADHLHPVAAALGASVDDLQHLAGTLPADAALGLESLSQCARHVSLARAAGMPVRELIDLKALTGIDPFGEPATARRFLEALGAVRAAGTTVPTLEYLLRGADAAPAQAPSPDRTAGAWSTLRKSVTEAASGAASAGADEAETVERLRGAVLRTLSRSLRVDGPLLALLLGSAVRWPLGQQGAPPIIVTLVDLTRQAPVDEETPPASFPVLFELLHRLALLVRGLKLTLADRRLLELGAGSGGGVDLGVLLDTSRPAAERFPLWERLREGAAFRAGLDPGAEVAFERIAAGTPDWSVPLGWDPEMVQGLLGHFQLQVTDLADPRWLGRIGRCIALGAETGVRADRLAALASAPGPAEAAAARAALRARYSDSVWPEVARPLRDALRVEQRDALVSAVLTEEDLRDTTELYNRLLVDVETGPCRTTTRIAAAVASVQAFVQRALIGLEAKAGVSLTEDAAVRWEWMKSYPRWVANRKVFLYPENWVKPELLDRKTPFFKELEEELLQSELTPETVENAYRAYLGKLDGVARLQVCAAHHELDDDTNVLHVFARTRDVPHVHYYRRWVDHAYWTPWEKVDVEIDGDQLVPVVFNRRLYLFWPGFDEEAEMPFNEIEKRLFTFFGSVAKLVVSMMSVTGQVGFQVLVDNAENLRQAAQSIPDVAGGLRDPLVRAIDAAKDNFGLLRDLAKIEGLEAVGSSRGEEAGGASFYRVQLPGSFDEAFSETKRTLLGAIEGFLSDESLTRLLPKKRWSVQLSWSECRNGAWSAKKVSPATLFFNDPTGFLPVGKKRLFSFRGIVEDGRLSVHCDVALPGVAPQNIGRFELDSAQGALSAVRVLEDLGFGSVFSNLAEDTTAAMSDQLRALAGLPVSPADQRGSVLREWILPALLDPLSPPFQLIAAPQPDPALGMRMVLFPPFFYQDDVRTFFVYSRVSQAGLGVASGLPGSVPNSGPEWTPERLFRVFYHPFSGELLQRLERGGVDALLREPLPEPVEFFDEYHPTLLLRPEGRPADEVDFSPDGAYSQYNWELFFHVPLLIASRLTTNRRFREAQGWLHTVFDPTRRTGEAPGRYWRFPPFARSAGTPEQIGDLLALLPSSSGGGSGGSGAAQAFLAQVDQWREDPSNPHGLCRLRGGAYQKSVVMLYLDNLLAWGDHLFRQETAESLNEAVQLYMLAAEILGRRPEGMPAAGIPDSQSFDTFGSLDAFSNALVELENLLPAQDGSGSAASLQSGRWSWVGSYGKDGPAGQDGKAGQNGKPAKNGKLRERGKPRQASKADSGWRIYGASPTLGHGLTQQRPYFCVPANDRLGGYWDRVGDRLFKIRHCMNLQGVVRQVPAFAPPIDPEVIARAAEAGVNFGEALDPAVLALPHYRFSVLAQKATELCAEVKILGASLLSALEKRDAETLAWMRSGHERSLLNAVRQVRELQVTEAREGMEGLRRSRELAELRKEFYERNLAMPLNPAEAVALVLQGVSVGMQAVQTAGLLTATALSLVPNFKGGFVSTLGVTFGGDNTSGAARNFAIAMGSLASTLGSASSMANTVGGYMRRVDEWTLQQQLAEGEIRQVDRQIAVAAVRVAIAERDLRSHQLQAANAREVDTFLQEKFTSRELYDWMVTEVAGLYFQAYQLAHETARRAEVAYRFELGLRDSEYIRFGDWDSLRMGLLAGERLHQDLKRMETAYLAQNRREHEITRHVSLRQLDPAALLQLKQTGSCSVVLPEVLFDLDHPGHFMRRIKSVGVSIPCVTGPYTGVHCTLTLEWSRIRCDDTLLAGKYAQQGTNDPRFVEDRVGVRSIVTSTGQNDSGLFEPGLRDERYLPFEGAGVISAWRLELPGTHRQFDYDTISDVVLHVRYTARESDASRTALKAQALLELEAALQQIALAGEERGLVRGFSARQELSAEWHRFLYPEGAAAEQALRLELRKELFPFLFQHRSLSVRKLELFFRVRPDFTATHNENTLQVTAAGPGGTGGPVALELREGLLRGEIAASGPPASWTLTVRREAPDGTGARFDPAALEDLFILCYYTFT